MVKFENIASDIRQVRYLKRSTLLTQARDILLPRLMSGGMRI